jgi:type I restriction enzyme S subunit
LQPPVEEQRRIVESVDSDTAGLQRAISHLEREIEFLLEYRTRLISDVVTGELDVREMAERLPIETTEPADTEGNIDRDELVDGTELNDKEVRL